MLNKAKMFVAICMILLFSSVSQADEIVSLKLGYILLSPDGEIAAEENGIGTVVDLSDDLDLDDSSGITAEAALSLGDWKLSVGYLPLSFEGSNVIDRTIIFDGDIYRVNSTVESTLDLDILDFGLTWYALNIDDLPTRFQLGLELSIKVTDAEASLTENTTGISDSASETLPIPTIGLRGRVAFSDFVGVSGRIGYLGYSGNHFMDADIQLEISPIPLVGVYVGYRYIDLSIDESDILVDTTLSGFYGGALVRF